MVIHEQMNIPKQATPNKSTLFLPQSAEGDENAEDEAEPQGVAPNQSRVRLNPTASVFTPAGVPKLPAQEATEEQPRWKTQFGHITLPMAASPGGPQGIMGVSSKNEPRATDAPASSAPHSPWLSLGNSQSASGTPSPSTKPEAASLPKFAPFAPFAPVAPTTQQNPSFERPSPTPPGLFQFPQPVKNLPLQTHQQAVNTETPRPTLTKAKTQAKTSANNSQLAALSPLDGLVTGPLPSTTAASTFACRFLICEMKMNCVLMRLSNSFLQRPFCSRSVTIGGQKSTVRT